MLRNIVALLASTMLLSGCLVQKQILMAIDQEEGLSVVEVDVVSGLDYSVFFFVGVTDTDSEPNYCRITYRGMNKPCGVILDDFSISVSLEGDGVSKTGSLETMVQEREMWTRGRIIPYSEAREEHRFLYKQPLLRRLNEGMGWQILKFQSNESERIKIRIDYTVKNREWLQFEPYTYVVPTDFFAEA